MSSKSRCPRCNQVFENGLAACPYCGLQFSTKKCPVCDTVSPSKNAYCENCGHNFPMYSSYTNQANNYSKKKEKKKNSGCLIAFIVILICVVISFGFIISIGSYINNSINEADRSNRSNRQSTSEPSTENTTSTRRNTTLNNTDNNNTPAFSIDETVLVDDNDIVISLVNARETSTQWIITFRYENNTDETMEFTVESYSISGVMLSNP